MKQLNLVKQWLYKLTTRHSSKGVYVKYNGDCEWMQNSNSETSARKVYCRHVN